MEAIVIPADLQAPKDTCFFFSFPRILFPPRPQESSKTPSIRTTSTYIFVCINIRVRARVHKVVSHPGDVYSWSVQDQWRVLWVYYIYRLPTNKRASVHNNNTQICALPPFLMVDKISYFKTPLGKGVRSMSELKNVTPHSYWWKKATFDFRLPAVVGIPSVHLFPPLPLFPRHADVTPLPTYIYIETPHMTNNNTFFLLKLYGVLSPRAFFYALSFHTRVARATRRQQQFPAYEIYV